MKIEINSPSFSVKVTAPNDEVLMDISVKDYHVNVDLIGLLAGVTQMAVAVNRADDVVTGKTPMSEVRKAGRPDDMLDALAYAIAGSLKDGKASGTTTGRTSSVKPNAAEQQQQAPKGLDIGEMLQEMFPGVKVERLDIDEFMRDTEAASNTQTPKKAD